MQNVQLGCNLHGACGGKVFLQCPILSLRLLQSARSVWRQSRPAGSIQYILHVAICTERVEAKHLHRVRAFAPIKGCNLHGACGGKEVARPALRPHLPLQSARSVWRQSGIGRDSRPAERLQSARSVWRQSFETWRSRTKRKVAICTERVEAKHDKRNKQHNRQRCNLHGACGGKAPDRIRLPK